MRIPLRTTLAFDYGDIKFASQRQASCLFHDVVTLQCALPHSRHQCTSSIFWIPGNEVTKIVQVQFVAFAWFLSRCHTKLQRQKEINKKVGNRVVVGRA